MIKYYNEKNINIGGIVCDNGGNYKKMRKLIAEKYPNLITLHCHSHLINLLVKDIMNFNKFQEVMNKSIQIVKYFNYSKNNLYRLRKIQQR